MLEPTQRTPKNTPRQVVGWVLVLPLLVSFVKLPFPLGLLLALGAMAASAYGVWFARRHASRRMTAFALIVTLLNMLSLVAFAEVSVLMGLYKISWLYWHPYYSEWVSWTL